MTDDNALPQRPEESVEPTLEPAATSPDDTPADGTNPSAEAVNGPGAIPDDHSMWMRPAEGEHERIRHPEPELDVSPAAADPTPEPGVVDTPGEGASPEVEPLPVHADAALVGARAALSRHEAAGTPIEGGLHTGASVAEPGRSKGWRGLIPWIAAALALGLAAFGLILNQTRKGVVVVTESPTPTPTVTPVITEADLMSVQDANLVQKQSWTAGKTLEKITSTSPHAACIISNPGQPNAILTRQRTLTSKAKDNLQTLHQIDAYATPADAQKVFQLRSGNVASCSDIPAWIVRSDRVSGIGDEAVASTIAYQEKAATTYHTVLLVRTGNSVHVFDAARDKQVLQVRDLLKGAAGPLERQCGRAKGRCAPNPSTTAMLPAPGAAAGWLLPADLPRITLGEGMWTGTDTKAIDTQGSLCEQMNLTSVAGPSQREQRTFLMTQDSAAPQNFGIDEVIFTFGKPAEAKAFSTKLSTNIRECQKRVLTAKVDEHAAVKGPGEKGITFEGTTHRVTQSLGGNQSTIYRVAVVTVGNKVVYLLNNPTKAYDPTSATFGQITRRAAERASQSA